MIWWLLIWAAGMAFSYLSFAYYRGLAEAGDWHSDGADIETLDEMGIDYKQGDRITGWAFRWGWRTYCLEARKRMKFKA